MRMGKNEQGKKLNNLGWTMARDVTEGGGFTNVSSQGLGKKYLHLDKEKRRAPQLEN